MKEQIDERNELVDLLEDIGHDWDAYLDECQENEEEPQLSYEDFHADAILEAGYRKQTDIAREIFEDIMQAIEKGVAEATEKVKDNTSYMRDFLVGAGEMYAGYIGKSIIEAFKKYLPQNAEKCVSCGDVIPEGRQVCPKCEKEN